MLEGVVVGLPVGGAVLGLEGLAHAVIVPDGRKPRLMQQSRIGDIPFSFVAKVYNVHNFAYFFGCDINADIRSISRYKGVLTNIFDMNNDGAIVLFNLSGWVVSPNVGHTG